MWLLKWFSLCFCSSSTLFVHFLNHGFGLKRFDTPITMQLCENFIDIGAI